MPSVSRLRAVPWAVLLQAVLAVREHWGRLDAKDRARLAQIARDSATTRTLSRRDREDLRRIASALDAPSLARSIAAVRSGRRR